MTDAKQHAHTSASGHTVIPERRHLQHLSCPRANLGGWEYRGLYEMCCLPTTLQGHSKREKRKHRKDRPQLSNEYPKTLPFMSLRSSV